MKRTVEQIEWAGCYDDSWDGFIVPEAFAHPAKFARGLITRIYVHMLAERMLAAGDTVVDPFGGIASGGIVAASWGLRWLGCELEQKFVDLGQRNIAMHRALWESFKDPVPVLVQGDSRKLRENLRGVLADCCVSSPPFQGSLQDNTHFAGFKEITGNCHRKAGQVSPSEVCQDTYGPTPGQLGAMPPGSVDSVVSSDLLATTLSPIIDDKEHGNDTTAKAGGGAISKRQKSRRNSGGDGLHPAGGVSPIAAGGSGNATAADAREVGLPQGGDRVPVQHAGHEPNQDCRVFRRELGGSAAGDEAAGDRIEVEGAGRTPALPIQNGAARPRLPEGDHQRQVPQVRGDGGLGDSPQERRSLRQPAGESGSALQFLPHERDEAQVVGGEEVRQAATQEQRPSRLASQVSAIISSPPYAEAVGTPSLGSVNKDEWGKDGRSITTRRGLTGEYGTSPGQLSALPVGQVDAIATSPPFRDPNAGKRNNEAEIAAGKIPAIGLRNANDYADMTAGNIAAANDETFWSAAKTIVAECYAILKPGGFSAWVCKDFVRNKQRVPFCDDWCKLLESQGFVVTTRVHAMLVKETSHPDLFGGADHVHKKERKSFFRRLAEKKGSPRIDFEEVIFARRPE